jgi:hypothetical protein
MVISDMIEDAIEEFRILHGREPTRLRLGKLQLAALRRFAECYSMKQPSPPSNSPPSFESSEGMRLLIDESPHEDELTLD